MTVLEKKRLTLKERYLLGRQIWGDPRAGIAIQETATYWQWAMFALAALIVGIITKVTLDSWVPVLWVCPVLAYNLVLVWAIKTHRAPLLWQPTLCAITAFTVVGYASAAACHFVTYETLNEYIIASGFGFSALAATWVYAIVFKVNWTTAEVGILALAGLVVPPLLWGLPPLVPLVEGVIATIGILGGGWWGSRQGREHLSVREVKDLLETANAKLQAEKATREVLGSLEEEIAYASAEDQATRARLMREVLDLASEAEEPLAAIQAVIDDPKYGWASKYVLKRLSRSSHALGTISLRGEDYWIPSGQIDAVEQLERAVSVVREIHSSLEIDVTIGEIPHPRLHWQNVEATFVLCLTTLMLYLIDTGATRLWARVTWDDLIVIDIEGDTQLPEDVRRSFATAILRKQHDPRWGINKLPLQLQRVRYFFDPSKIFVDNTRPERQWGNPHANDPERRNNAIFEIRVPAEMVVGAKDPMKVATRGWQRPQPKEGVH